jgi:hypothetical protein
LLFYWLDIFFYIFCRLSWFWLKWSVDLLLRHSLPVYILKPDVGFYFVWTIQTKAIWWFTLQGFINKISRFKTPMIRHVTFFKAYLSIKYFITNFLPIFTNIRSFSHHEFVSNDTNCKVINCNPMILSTHNFRCHITWSSWCILRIFWCKLPWNT